jgi:hypothetical protein
VRPGQAELLRTLDNVAQSKTCKTVRIVRLRQLEEVAIRWWTAFSQERKLAHPDDKSGNASLTPLHPLTIGSKMIAFRRIGWRERGC